MDVGVWGDEYLMRLRSLQQHLSILSNSPVGDVYVEELKGMHDAVEDLTKMVQAKQEAEGYG